MPLDDAEINTLPLQKLASPGVFFKKDGF